MPVETELPEIIVESSTQTPEQIRTQLGKLGYDNVDVTSQTDQEAEETEVAAPVEETQAPVVEAPKTSETPAAGEPAGKAEPQTAGVTMPVEEKPRVPGSVRNKEKAKHQEEENKRLRARVEALEKKLADAPVSTPTPQTATSTQAVTPPAKTEDDDLKAPVPEAGNPRPKYENFATADDPMAAYTEAVADWRFDERERERRNQEANRTYNEKLAKQNASEKAAKAKVEANQQAYQKRWNDSVAAVKPQLEDFDVVMNAPRPQPVHPALVVVVSERDDIEPAELAYHLTKDPAKEAALAKLIQLPENPTDLQIQQAKRRLNRAIDPIVDAIIAERAKAEAADDAEAKEEPDTEPATEASREIRETADSSSQTPAAKVSPQLPPPGQEKQAQPAPVATAPAKPPKAKPAVPSPVGNRASSSPADAYELVQKGKQVDADAYRAAWEKRHGNRPV